MVLVRPKSRAKQYKAKSIPSFSSQTVCVFFVFLEVLVLLLCAHNPHALIFIYIMIYISTLISYICILQQFFSVIFLIQLTSIHCMVSKTKHFFTIAFIYKY